MLPSGVEPASAACAHDWSLKTIELVEVPAPPKRNVASLITTSTGYYSSSYASSSDLSDEEGEGMDEDDDAEDEDGTEYCSSEEDLPAEDGRAARPVAPFTQHRVLAWRAASSARSTNDAAPQDACPSPVSCSPPESPVQDTPRRLPHACCSACDACFASLQTYRRHGSDAGASEPCRAAVSYGLESARSEP